MANEIQVSTIGDLITGEVLSTEVLMLLADRDASLLTHPAIMRATAMSPTSNVVRVRHIGLNGYDLMTATTPGSEVANTALTDGSTDVTIAPYAKVYRASDLSVYLGSGLIGAEAFARDLVQTHLQTQINIIANIGDDFTTVVGTTGVNIDWDDISDAKTTLGVAKAQGEVICILHPRQWGDLEKAALSLGVIPDSAGLAGAIMTGLGSYKGRYMGIDFFTSSYVPTANSGADRAGCMFVRGGIAMADAPAPSEGADIQASFGPAKLEIDRKGTFIETAYVYSAHQGGAKAIDGAGVTLTTDA